MTQIFPVSPALAEAVGRHMAKSAGRSYACLPMLWNDIGNQVVRIVAEPQATIEIIDLVREVGKLEAAAAAAAQAEDAA